MSPTTIKIVLAILAALIVWHYAMRSAAKGRKAQ